MIRQNYIFAISVLVVALAIGAATRLYAAKLRASTKPQTARAAIVVHESADPSDEYLKINVSGDSSLWNFTGLEIAQGSFAARIGGAVKTFLRGHIAANRPIVSTLPATLIINSGRSPVGESFQLNKCSGFLEEYQSFSPPIVMACPSVREILSRQHIGVPTQCADYFSTLPSCSALPENVPAECKNILIEHAQYNQCVETFKNDADFTTNEWRVFLESDKPLWSTTTPIKFFDAIGEALGQTPSSSR